LTEVNHFRRVLLIWLVSAVILTPIVVIFFAPLVPPGQGSVQASGQVQDNTILFALATPIALAVLVFIGYELIVFRERDPAATVEGPAIRGNAVIQIWWLMVTTTIVLFLAGYATYRMFVDGAGGGQGPTPASVPVTKSTGPALQVQVIAQQWEFTYRYPGYGGVETSRLELPADRLIEFHVTSLDVVHSFWAYQLAVKADANPGFDNIAFVKTRGPRLFDIRCAELCGVWHGYMSDHGQVVPAAQFATWIKQQQQRFAPVTKSLPPYSTTYFPDPQRRGG
jgi:cytochrome c oxidase subunit 2